MDINSLRNDTPGTQHYIHLNNAGASLQPQPVIDAVQQYLTEEALHGGYETAAARSGDIKGFYQSCASLLGTQPDHVEYMSSGATEAYNKALSSIPLISGDVILTTDDDYSSNQIAFLFLEKTVGVKIVRAAKLPVGGVDVDSVEKLIKKHHPKLVAVTHVPTNSGLVQDVESIGQLCKEHDIWYLVDACQSAGQMPLEVDKIGCDFLSATLRKWLRGPRGAGFLYVSNKALKAGLEPVFPDLSGAMWTAANEYKSSQKAQRFGYFEKNYALLVGSKVAMDYALNLGLDNIENRVSELATYTRQRLAELPGWKVLDLGKNKCGIVTAHHERIRPTHFEKALKTATINAGFARTFNAVIDFTEKGVDWAMRVSPHYYNTKEEVDVLIDALKTVV
ncbi:MAG: aminotransferase class V-fold PLP-dependent enzyme [Saprospiraceae bacterium]